MDAKDEYERRKENMILVDKYRRDQMRKLSKTAKDSKEGDMMKLGVDPIKKDFSDL